MYYYIVQLSTLIFFTHVVKNPLAQNSEIHANGNFSMIESILLYRPIGLIPERDFFATFGTTQDENQSTGSLQRHRNTQNVHLSDVKKLR